ncbi:MAG: winged helix-turn-helix domain-containing protein [Gammaproteobacteria bacterium]|nr:winged helix-turn-helix domain-containing protein [Gammaproteobacteria bacterium]HOP17326.1 winged helix-turn-helix domain-containing protein [Gammaproteobacteria bacterium]
MPIQMDQQPSAQADSGSPREVQFRLGDWVVDVATRDIRRAGTVVRLEPKVMRVLEFLVGRRGQVVSRYDLESHVWSGMVVTDDAVTNTVIKLRKALGDKARDPRYIETIAKTGYRLIADVEPLPGRAGPLLPPGETPPGDELSRTAAPTGGPKDGHPGPATGQVTVAPPQRPRIRRGRLLPVLMLVSLAVAGGLALYLSVITPPPTAAAGTVVAVLPFDNLSGDPEQDYFADGITQDLITDLSKLSNLQVLARNSALAYRASTEPESVIGRELGARFLVRGSVQRSGERLRINVSLTDAVEGRNRWGERYDRQLADIFHLQDEITAHVVSALQVELAPGEQQRLTRRYVTSIEAYDALLRGLDLLGRRASADNAEARAQFERAIELEPGFARAYAGLAMTHAMHATYGHGPQVAASLERAETIARQGMAIDEAQPQLHFAMGLVEMYRGNLAAAAAEVSRAIELRPSFADGYGLMAWILHFAGRPDEGLEAMRRAIALNPHVTALYRTVKAALHYELGELDQARALLEESVEMNPDQLLTRLYLAAVYAATGQFESARWQVDEIRALDAGFRLDLAYGFPIRDPRYRARFLADLARAGLAAH